MNRTLATVSPVVPALESVLCTEELNRRPARPPDYERESRALVALAQALADSPRTILQALADTILEVFQADSAGISLVTEDEKRFHWPAIAGAWKQHIGGGTPRDFGPCGDVLDRNGRLLFRHFERRYTYFLPVTPPVEECLLIPFYVKGKAVGTIWAIAHDERRQFDGEDLRMLVSLGTFASSAYQALEQLHAFSKQAHERQEAAQALREMNEALLLSSVRQHELTEQAEKAEALLSCQKQAFEMIAVGAPLLEVLEFLARATESQSPQQALVAIHLLDESGARFEQTVAPSLTPGYSQAVNGMAVSSATGSCCAAVARRRRVVVADIAASKEWPAFASFALPLGLRAACSTPIFSSSGKVIGTFVTYYREVREPEPQEELLAEIVTRTAAVVIERKEAEEKLRASHGRFQAVFDASPIGMYLVDAEFRIRQMSRKARPIFGDLVLADGGRELIGSDFVEVIHILWPPAIADEIVARFRHTLATGAPYSAPEFSEERYDRKVREYYDWQIHRIALPDGQYGVVCYFIEISERMRLSNELRQVAADMSEADRRKNEFLAMLAHELRNPLAPIRNALEIMRLTGGNGKAVASASKMMERQVGQMVRLVDDLLDVSRISRGKIELRMERVELASVVHHAVEACRSLYTSMDHELTVTLPPEPVYLNADPTRLAQVVGNLLNNACKFTDKGGRIELVVSVEGRGASEEKLATHHSALATPFAVIRVRDNGVGIAADQLHHIFDMFTQIDTSLERSVSGLGIGLTLVKNLVEMHGGTVLAHSAGVGQGSEFVVRLPILRDEERGARGEKEETGGDSLAPHSSPRAPRRRILVVDDNRDSATSLAMLLKLTGNETHTAFDGLEAVEAAVTFRPDVVLLDIGLPKLNGYEAARKIREQPGGQKMALVALTGWGQDEDRQRSREAGFDGHMVKPVDLAALMKLLAGLAPNPV